MNKTVYRFSFAVLGLVLAFSCRSVVHDTEELVDPWTRERTPVNFRLESQVGAAVISDNWRNDQEGSITVSLLTGMLNMSSVKVVALDFKFPDSEFCPTASIGPGDKLDLSSGKASFTVTAHSGETRTYTVTYDSFSDPLEGVYTMAPRSGLLDGGSAADPFVIIGCWDGEEVMSTLQDKSWHWGDGYQPADEKDNVFSFRLEDFDSETGDTFGTVVNLAGDDGKYANFVYNNSVDINDKYRIIPVGKARWSKPSNGNGTVVIYDYDDTAYSTPVVSFQVLESGTYTYHAETNAKTVEVADKAFVRTFPGPFNNPDWNYDDARWFYRYLKEIFWLVKKDSDAALPNHADYLAD